MSSGREYTLCDFGWNATQASAVQAVKVQSALDSGEPLVMPVGETVHIDQPLFMEHCPSLRGYGGDLTNQCLGASQFQCDEPAVDILTIKKNHAHVSGIGFHGTGDRYLAGGRGIVVGDGLSHVVGVVIERVTTNRRHAHGIHVRSAGGLVVDRCWLWGHYSALKMQNVVGADTGDNKITNCDFNADMEIGAGIRWTSGGGLYIHGSKFNMGFNHLRMDWSEGSSGNFALIGSSLETCASISVDIRGSHIFKRAQFVGNTWGINSAAIAVRNYNATPGDAGTPWLEDLNISGNTIHTGGAGGPTTYAPAIDLGCVKRALVQGNNIFGHGTASQGIILRQQAVDSAIGPNLIRGCTTPVVNYSLTSSVSAQL